MGGRSSMVLPSSFSRPSVYSTWYPSNTRTEPRGPEEVLAEIEVHDGHVVDRRRHLRGDEPLPDQLVEPVLVRLQIRLQLLRTASHVGGPDGFVGALHPRGLLRLVGVGRLRQVRFGVALPNEVSHRRDGRVRHLRRVGSHVGDETDRPILTDFLALVEILRRAHGAAGGEAELLGRLLLQRAGGERARPDSSSGCAFRPWRR